MSTNNRFVKEDSFPLEDKSQKTTRSRTVMKLPKEVLFSTKLRISRKKSPVIKAGLLECRIICCRTTTTYSNVVCHFDYQNRLIYNCNYLRFSTFSCLIYIKIGKITNLNNGFDNQKDVKS